MAEYRKIRFKIDDSEDIFEGYTLGEHWNGFECPRFTKEEGLKIVSKYNNIVPCFYNADNDTFYIDDTQYEGHDIDYNSTTIHVYAIGAWGWVWEECRE